MHASASYLPRCLVHNCQSRGVLQGVVVHLLHCWVPQESVHSLLDVVWPAAAAVAPATRPAAAVDKQELLNKVFVGFEARVC